MATRYTIHATLAPHNDMCSLTFEVERRTEEGARLQCCIALMQLGYKSDDFTLEVQNVVRQPEAFAVPETISGDDFDRQLMW